MKALIYLSFIFLGVSKLNAQEGTLDPTFGTNGSIAVSFDAFLAPDGKLLRSEKISTGFKIYRYNVDGSPDASFGSNGVVTSTLDFQGNPGIGIEKDGKIVAGGTTSISTNNVTSNIFYAFQCFNVDGTPDISFGNNGIILVFDASAISSRIGSLYKMFFSNNNEIIFVTQNPEPFGPSYGIIRLSSNGGQNFLPFPGPPLTNLGDHRIPSSIVFTTEGKFVIGGRQISRVFPDVMVLSRVNSDGTPDSTFGTNGYFISNAGNDITTLAIQEDGKILASSNNKLFRFTTFGSLDSTFGVAGIVNSPLAINKIVVQASGKIIAGGTLNGNFALARFNSNGTLDPSFGTAGTTISDFGGTESIQDMTITDHRLYAYGTGILAAYQLGNVVCIPPTFVNNGLIILDATCANNDGNINIIPTSGTAPFMYSINGGTTYVAGPNAGYGFQNLPSGTYKLRLKDANGCESAIVEREVKLNCTTACTPPTFVNNGLIILDATCANNDGNINIIPISGTAPFMYSINGGATYVAGPNAGYGFQNLPSGTYKLRLKDANGCESAIVERQVKLLCTTCTPPTFVNNGLIVLDASCGKSDGAINIIPTSGTAPFMYSINGGATYVAGPNGGYGFQNSPAGTYQLRLKDARGCQSAIVERTVRNYYNCPGVTVSASRFEAAALALSNKDFIATYPNPNHGQFKLLLQNFQSSKAEVLIYDAKGTLIQTRTLNLTQNTNADFDLRGKAPGLYLIKVVGNNEVKSLKVMIQ
jgi:uncharacterized delta-60 repeat protein